MRTRNPSLRARSVRAIGLLAAITLASSATAQMRLPRGEAWKIRRGPSLSFCVLKASDGTGEKRLLLDTKTPGAKWSFRRIRGGFRLRVRASYTTPELGAFTVQGEIDAIGPRFFLSWDLTARIAPIRADLAVSRIGIELDMLDVPGEQALLVPVFSGGEFVEPADSIPLGTPVDTNSSHSVQATAYYSTDGTGLLLFPLDPKGTKPKRFFYESGRDGDEKTISMALEYFVPESNKGGGGACTLAPIRVSPYVFASKLTRGWVPAAKIYRRWIERYGRCPGGILEKGPLETRADVPKWMKEMDLLVSEQYGWFPELALVPDPLLNLIRLKTVLGVENMFVGLFFWQDKFSLTGLTGSWYPLPATANQVRLLKTFGIRSSGYTFPAAFDVINPFFAARGLVTEVAELRNGTAVPIEGTVVQMDLSSPKLADWYEELGAFHSKQNSMSGFFSDLPAGVGTPDFRRPAGQPEGVTESSYLGYRNILARTQVGANKEGNDFVQYHESAFDWLIPVATFGQGAVGTIGRAYQDEPRTRGVPFFQTVYSGYTLFWPAEEGLGFQTLIFVPDAYGDLTKNNISRLLAEGFTWGNLPNHSEIFLNFGRLYFEPPIPLPPELLAPFLHHGNTLKNLIQLRRESRPWLVFGEMLNSPVAGGDLVDVVIKRPFNDVFVDQTFSKPKVPATAWRAKDKTVRIVAANGGTDEAAVVLNLRRIGLFFARGVEDVKTNERFFAMGRSRDIRVTVAGGTGRLLRPFRH